MERRFVEIPKSSGAVKSPALPPCKSVLARDLILAYRLCGFSGVEKLINKYTETFGVELPTDVSVLFMGLKALHGFSGEVCSVDLKDSGTALRFLVTTLSLQGGCYFLTGSERLSKRPIQEIVDLLSAMGIVFVPEKRIPSRHATISLPFTLKSKGRASLMLPEAVYSDEWRSSQFVSALLLNQAVKHVYLNKKTPSASYVRLTLARLKAFGIQSEWGDACITLNVTSPLSWVGVDGIKYYADWSAASFWYQFLALSSQREIYLGGLDLSLGHPDQSVVGIYERYWGIRTIEAEKGIEVIKSDCFEERDIVVDLSQSPDLFLSFACSCLGHRRSFHITGLSLLPFKESDRMRIFVENARALGYEGFSYTSSSISYIAQPQKKIFDAVLIDPQNDHRMAMAFSILANSELCLNRAIVLSPDVVKKSYPKFWEELIG